MHIAGNWQSLHWTQQEQLALKIIGSVGKLISLRETRAAKARAIIDAAYSEQLTRSSTEYAGKQPKWVALYETVDTAKSAAMADHALNLIVNKKLEDNGLHRDDVHIQVVRNGDRHDGVRKYEWAIYEAAQ